jgi:hypothetical protein
MRSSNLWRRYDHRSRLGRALTAIATVACIAHYTPTVSAQTVGDVARAGSCDSSPTNPLQMQIVATHRCMFAGDLTDFAAGAGISFVGNVLPVINADTAARLRRAAQMRPIQMTSGYRTIAGQYVLSRSTSPQCMTPAAVGSSPHHTGRAIDASNHAQILGAMQAAGCEQSYPANDPVHFNCPGWTDNTLKAHSIAAFQRLWNVNHPMQRIAEDGAYGPQTEGALVQSPVRGFASTDGCARNTPPRGDLNSASCATVTGWAQDTDEPMRAIDVHLYIDGMPGQAGARSFAVRAGDARPDLCMPLGSCNHAFTWIFADEFKDGRAHTVRAYAIDSAGGTNPQVGPARMVTCDPPVVVMDASTSADSAVLDAPDPMQTEVAAQDSAATDSPEGGPRDVEYVRLPDGNLVPIDSLPGCQCRAPSSKPVSPAKFQYLLWSALALCVARNRARLVQRNRAGRVTPR